MAEIQGRLHPVTHAPCQHNTVMDAHLERVADILFIMFLQCTHSHLETLS